MQGSNQGITSKDALKQMYRSGIKASYFAGMREPHFMEKSKLQINKIEDKEEEEIDERTFRLMGGFKRPDQQFGVYSLNGNCYIEKESFFSCLSKRRCLQIVNKNSKLIIQSQDRIFRFIDFNVVEARLRDQGDSFTLTFQGSSKEVYVQIATPHKEAENAKWVKQLTKIINETEGKPKKRSYIVRKNPIDFCNTQHVLNEEFQKQANSGDILLFKSKHSAASIQRVFTDSEYDHVGIVLRNQKNEIFIFESTSEEGVGLTPWKHMVNYEWYDQTDKIVWRKLNMELGNRQISIIQAFVAKTLGKGFQLSLDKLFQFKSTLHRTQEMDDKKTYFCSELAARLYKQLGILDEEKSSTTYYPVDFSEKNRLKIIKPGVSVSNELLISFDK